MPACHIIALTYKVRPTTSIHNVRFRLQVTNNKNVLLVPICTLKHHARQAQAQAMVRDHIGLTTSVTTVTMAQSSPTKAFPCHSALVSHNVNGISL